MSNLIPFGFFGDQTRKVWTDLSLGDVTVLSGQTINLTPGNSYNYGNLVVNAGGTLNILAGAGIVAISAISITINGTITGTLGQHAGTTYSITIPDQYTKTFVSTQRAGGQGRESATLRGAGSFGNGSSGVSPYNGTTNQGANGTGCTGGAIYSGAGGNSGTFHGAGGARGRHGLGLILNAYDIFGTGTINLNGSAGGKGGNAGGTQSCGKICITTYGGGGGGGAGGNGGVCWFEYINSYSTTLFTNTNVNAGAGGAVGTSPTSGQNGVAGSAGTAGTKTLIDLKV